MGAHAQGDSRVMEPLDQDSFFDGTHWTSWSQNFGCPNADPSPFGINGPTSVTNFCRARGLKDLNKKPESFQFRFCTLPNIITDQDQPTWIYANGKPTVNQYPTAGKPIKSKANPNHAKFSDRLKIWQNLLGNQGAAAFLEEANDFRQTAGPAGDNKGLVQFSDLFVNLERQSIWVDPFNYASNRPACDPRLEESAKKCFADAFDSNGDPVNDFCIHIPGFTGYTLNEVQSRKDNNPINNLSSISFPIHFWFMTHSL